MQKTKFGIIGANMKLRAVVAERYYPREKAELVAICDHDPEMLKKFFEEMPEYKGIKAYSDYRDMIADPVQIVCHENFFAHSEGSPY